jgi:hypothetical protein
MCNRCSLFRMQRASLPMHFFRLFEWSNTEYFSFSSALLLFFLGPLNLSFSAQAVQISLDWHAQRGIFLAFI